MQITHVEVIPIELPLRVPYRTLEGSSIDHTAAILVRIETKQGLTAWGATAIDPIELTGWSSNVGRHVVPPSVVFHKPPEAAPM